MRETTYNPLYHDDWAWSLATKGATNAEIANAFGISTRQFIRWVQRYESLARAVQCGKDAADSKVEKSLYQRATGFQITDTVETIDVKDGVEHTSKITKTTKNYPPDTMAGMYWLNNRMRPYWSQRQEVQVTTEAKESDVTIYLPAVDEDEEEDKENG